MKPLFICLVLLSNHALAGKAIPFPFEGLFESRGSLANEWLGAGRWRAIPQDVQMRVSKDIEIIEIQLRIDVQDPGGEDGSSSYTILNSTWLVPKPRQDTKAQSGRVEFDVYKKDARSGRFEDRGDGLCESSDCQYYYTLEKPGYQQRYRSRITWQPQQAGTRFVQRGGLSRKKNGESQFLSVKTWENAFRKTTVKGP